MLVLVLSYAQWYSPECWHCIHPDVKLEAFPFNLSACCASTCCLLKQLCQCCPTHDQDWELLSEVPLLQQGGTGGAALPARPAADATADHPQAALSPDSVSITWRGDGLFFATTSLDSPGALRMRQPLQG